MTEKRIRELEDRLTETSQTENQRGKKKKKKKKRHRTSKNCRRISKWTRTSKNYGKLRQRQM